MSNLRERGAELLLSISMGHPEKSDWDELPEELRDYWRQGFDRILSLVADSQPHPVAEAGLKEEQSFKPTFNENTAHPMKHEPTGTNLFDYGQADAMVRYMLEGMPAALSAQGEALREAFVAGVAEGFVSGRSKISFDEAKKAGRAEAERRYPRQPAPAEPEDAMVEFDGEDWKPLNEAGRKAMTPAEPPKETP